MFKRHTQPCKAEVWGQMGSLCPLGGKKKVELRNFMITGRTEYKPHFWCVGQVHVFVNKEAAPNY